MPLLEQVENRLDTIQFAFPPEIYLTPSTLSDIINHIDTNWANEGLSRDWYTLSNRVGFSMKKQMELLPNLEDHSLALWIERTEQDMAGFWLEYLTPEINVYPYRYIKEVREDGAIQLTNIRYQKDITGTASEEERSGSVVTTLEEIKQFFGSNQTIDGSLAIMVSPSGPTGLKTDDEKPIDYPDSYFLLFEKKGDLIEGFTIQTDFTKKECREVIRRLTGIQLADNASEEQYIRATAFLTPLFNQAEIKTKQDILHLLQKVRSDNSWNSDYAYKNISWDQVADDVNRVDDLYSLDIESDVIVEEWKRFMSDEHFLQMTDEHSEQNIRLTIQKALAATILRLSKLSLGRTFIRHSVQEFQPRMLLQSLKPVNIYSRDISLYDDFTFGDAQRYAESQPGCAGGGTSNNSPMELLTIQSITPRLGIVKGDFNNTNDSCPKIKCEYCGWQPNDSQVKAIQSGTLTACGNCGRKPS